VLQSASFLEGFPARFVHARLVSSQSFPHLWKKLWKFAEVEYTAQIGADMNLWDRILARIETKMNRHTFYTWFRPTSFVAEDRSSITVRVPDVSFQEWLSKHYGAVISEAMAELKRPNMTVHFVSESAADTPTIALNADETAAFDGGTPAPPAGPGIAAVVSTGKRSLCASRAEPRRGRARQPGNRRGGSLSAAPR